MSFFSPFAKPMPQISSSAFDMQNPRILSPSSTSRTSWNFWPSIHALHAPPKIHYRLVVFEKPTPHISSLASDIQNPRIWPPSSASCTSMSSMNFDCRSMRHRRWLWLLTRRVTAFFLLRIWRLWLEGLLLLLLLFLKTQITYFSDVRSFYFHMSLIYLKMEVLRRKLMLLNKIWGSQAETQRWAIEMMPKGFRYGDKPIQARNKGCTLTKQQQKPNKNISQ